MSDPLARLRELCRDLPDDLVADWRGTNHFELHDHQCKDGKYWWLDLTDFGNYDTESGQRAGLLLDIAAEVSRLKREGVL